MARKRMREKDEITLKLLFIMLAIDNGSCVNVPYVKRVLLAMTQKFGREKIDKKFSQYNEELKLEHGFGLTKLIWDGYNHSSDGEPVKVGDNGLLKWENTTDPKHPDFDPKGGMVQ